MFIIQHRKGETSIIEVECEALSAAEDPSVAWQKSGEHRLKIVQPKSLFEKQEDGTLMAPVWWNFAFYESIELALDAAERDIWRGMERDAQKSHTELSREEYGIKCALIKTIRL